MQEIVVGSRHIPVIRRRKTAAQLQIAAEEKAARSAGRGVFHLDRPQKRGRFAVAEKSERTIDGTTFDSKKEMRRYTQLKLLERAGLIDELTIQPSWDVSINDRHFTRYTADFSYLCTDRKRTVIEDVKSTGTAKDEAYRLRRKAAELAHGIRIDEVLM